MKTRLARFIDNFFICFISFIIFFILLKSLITNNFIILIISLSFSFLLLKIIIAFQNRTLKKLSIKTKEQQDIIDCNFALRKLSLSSQITFFKNLFKDKQTLKTTKGLIIENKIYFFILLNIDKVNPEQIFYVYSKIKNLKSKNIEEICIVCNGISEDAKVTIKNLSDINFSVFTPIETYSLMKKYTFYPTLSKKPIKRKNILLKHEFMKQNGKNFIKYGLLLYLFSLFSPIFTLYYICFASAITLTGILILLFGKSKIIIEPLSQKILFNT